MDWLHWYWHIPVDIAFLAQKGFDEDNWPEGVRERVKSVRVPKILTWP